MLVTGCIGLALDKVKEESQNIENLKSIRNFTRYLIGEISHTHIPIPDICEEYLNRADNWFKDILKKVCEKLQNNQGKSFDCIWEDVVSKNCSQNRPLKEEKKQLLLLGKCFGFCNTNTQLSALEKYVQELESLILQKEKRFYDNKKLIIYFGVMSGLFLSIMLL